MLNYYNQYQNQNKLIQVFTIVFYIGEKKWNSHRSLKEMMDDIPEELERYFNDYRIILVDIKDIDTAYIDDQETRDMIYAIQSIYDVEKKDMEQILLTKEAALTAGYITKSKWLIEEARQDKEEINMCEAMERYAQRKVEEGKRIGREQGKQEEKRNVVVLLLTKKLGKLSDQIIHLIETSSTERINQLMIQIFDIENEDDIIKFIH